MLTPITTHRDIAVFRQGRRYLTIAADTLGAIGEKPADHLCAPPELGGRLTARVCLIETLAVGATPVALTALTCNEHEPTGMRLLAGIRAELAEAGLADLPLGGSSEDNMPTSMTALGITLLGACAAPAWRRARPGDGVYLAGLPYVGPEVIAHLDELLTPARTRDIRALPMAGDLLPCGSRGIGWELRVLEREIGLPVQLAAAIAPALLTASA
ncbi:MAG TPA: alpha-ribazole kinase, partial [Armatimonadota bacterium]|nr:alpha-ribazole kinase [Armatimonadota bacterium]